MVHPESCESKEGAEPPPLTFSSTDATTSGLMGGEKQQPQIDPGPELVPEEPCESVQQQQDANSHLASGAEDYPVFGPANKDNETKGMLAITYPNCPDPTSTMLTSYVDNKEAKEYFLDYRIKNGLKNRLSEVDGHRLLPNGGFGQGRSGFRSAMYKSEDKLDENGHPYVGLVNQAMTCYLNSLLQTLYMTPEFRNAIYNWKFSGTQREETKSIPFQLQKLFLLLQTSEKHSLETKELTASFGWQSNDAYDQHDVQELCRLMFDALEHRWRNTENRTLIQDLYKGTMEDYVKCLNCSTVRAKPDVFLDLPLAVKEFGAKQAYESVEEALQAFTKPELLDGNNQYFCETCKSKQNAEKGLRITQFPYLLTIQLKRFDFDYNNLHRIKLHDRMTFPSILDLNKFLHHENPEGQALAADTIPQPQESLANTAKTYASAASTSKAPPLQSEATAEEVKVEGEREEAKEKTQEKADEREPPDPTGAKEESDDETQAEKEWKKMWKRNPGEVAELIERNGKYVYELFSIMVHQGSASGGHYYAYIKNLGQNRWFCFNDSSVQPASLNDVFQTYGGGTGNWSINNTSAYMLMYRRVDPSASKDAHFIRSVDLPPHLIELKEKIASEEMERQRKQRELEEMVKVTFIVNDSVHYLRNEVDGMEKAVDSVAMTLKLNKGQTIAEVHQVLCEATTLSRISCANSRLITCDRNWNMTEELDDAEVTLSNVMKSHGGYMYPRDEIYLLLETAMRNDKFYPLPRDTLYSKNIYSLDLVRISLHEQKLWVERRICLNSQGTVADIYDLLHKVLPCNLYPDEESIDSLRIVADLRWSACTQMVLLDRRDTRTLAEITDSSYYITRAQLIIDVVEEACPNLTLEDRKRDFQDSLLFKILDTRKNIIRFRVFFPSKMEYQLMGIAWKPINIKPAGRPPVRLDPVQPRPPLPRPSSVPELVLAVNPPDGQQVSDEADDIVLPNTMLPTTMECHPPSSFDALSSVSGTVPPPYPTQDSPASSNSASNLAVDGGGWCGGDEDEQMDVSTMSTPKRSPVVSDAGSGEEAEGAPYIKHSKGGGMELGSWSQEDIESRMYHLAKDGKVMVMQQEDPVGSSIDDEALSTRNSNTATASLTMISQQYGRPPMLTALSSQQRLPHYCSTRQMEAEWLTGAGGGGGEEAETITGGSSTTDSMPSVSTTTATVTCERFPVGVREVSWDPVKGAGEVSPEERPWICVEVDRRKPAGDFKRWVAQNIQLDTSSFRLFKHHNDPPDSGYSASPIELVTLGEAFSLSINHVSVKLDLPRRDNEELVAIVKFERDLPDPREWPTIFHVVVGEATTAGELLAKCCSLFHNVYQNEYRPEQLRLRDLTDKGAISLKRDDKIMEHFKQEWRYVATCKRTIYLQILEDEESVDEKTVPVMVMQWCPSSLEVKKPKLELQLRADAQGEPKALKKLIAQHSTLPVERIQLSEPYPHGGSGHPWIKWPYTKSVLELADGEVKFNTQEPLDGSYGGKLVYYKDSNEFAKTVSEEDRKTIKIRESTQTFNQQPTGFMRRKERPLRIQMNSVSEAADDA